MLRDVIEGKTYEAVAAQHGVTRTAIERRIKSFALKLSKQVRIDGLNEDGVAFVQRLRACKSAILAALDRYKPQEEQEPRARRILTDEDIQLAVRRLRSRSPCASRDVSLFYLLLTTGARPLEVARLEVRDYLDPAGAVREESLLRAEVAINRKPRPLFFTTGKATEALDRYLEDRLRLGFGVGSGTEFRGLDAHSPLFLSDTGGRFEIVDCREHGQTRFLCRGIHDTYRKIFRRIGIGGISALSVRRTVATRLWERGAAEEQIGEILGISDLKSVRELLPTRRHPLAIVVRELI